MRLTGTILICLVLFVLAKPASADRLTPETLWDLVRIGDAAVSPDGKQIAYLVKQYDLAENSGTSSLMVQSLPATLDSDVKAAAFESPLLNEKSEALLKDIKGLGSLNWLAHSTGSKLVYIAPGKPAPKSDKKNTKEDSTDEPGEPQAWMLDPATGEAEQLTNVEDGIGNLITSPSGDAIAFTVDVKIDQEVTEIYEDLPKADARIIDSLMYRHWNQWHDYAYSHVHVVSIDDKGKASEPLDLMATLRADCPLPPFGGSEQFTFSNDGKEMALTLKLVNNPAESTDSGIYLISTQGGALKNITPGMPGYDMDPTYSPDGTTIAFHSMERAGFESDRNRIMLYNRSSGKLEEVTEGLNQTTHHATWSEDSKSLYFHSETRGTTQVFKIEIDNHALQQVSEGRFNFSIVACVPGSNR